MNMLIDLLCCLIAVQTQTTWSIHMHRQTEQIWQNYAVSLEIAAIQNVQIQKVLSSSGGHEIPSPLSMEMT